MSYFQQKLANTQQHAADLLMQLQRLHGLVFLYDQNQPIIAFLPQQYLLCQATHTQRFEQVAFNQYQLTDSAYSATDFVRFDQTNAAPSDEFCGGYIGFLSYDYSAQPIVANSQRVQPSLYLGKYLSYLRFEEEAWYFCSTDEQAEAIFAQLQALLKQQELHSDTFYLHEACSPRWSKPQYMNAFHKIQDYIKAGDCYQINLTQEFTATAQGSLLNTAKQLWQLTHAPYAGYLQLDEFELLSCSPELFIEFQANRQIKTRPIKGTMPRFDDAEQDRLSKQKLSQSEKDQAENLMIVDLLRNDLSVYAETGSVKTNQLFEIESFNQVHHMVSEITARLKAEVHPMQMLLSALPGGSITGAPKIRAMQIIEELEGAPRGAYCGSLGYFNFDGTGRWNILIRSIQKYQNHVSLWAGGGITIGSDAEAEYQECFDKISAILDLLNTWQKKDV